jgi:hypothetical protein
VIPSERVNFIANAISDGMNCVASIQSLRASTTVADRESLETWRNTLEECKDALEIIRRGDLEGRPLTASWRPNDKLIAAIESFLAQLPAIAPGAQIPPSLFDLADTLWQHFSE